MNKSIGAALAAGALLALSACGGGGSHAVCKDEATARDYMNKAMGEMQANAGNLAIDRLEEMQNDMAAIGEAGARRDWGGACTLIDEMRAKLGI